MKLAKYKKRWGVILILLSAFAILTFYPLPPQDPIQYFERESGQIKTEKVAGENWLVWLYNNPVGEATLWALVKRKVVSSMYGNMMDRPSSVKRIQPFVEEYDIDLSIAKRQEFTSFNDFFTRKLKTGARPVNDDSTIAVSPADGKILAYQNIANSDFIIKGYRFDVASFLQNTDLAKNYAAGSMVIVRVAPPDYHRFHFPVGGRVSPVTRIDGWYYSVNPIALRDMVEIFIINKRAYTMISNPLFGDVIMAEVGATMVGSIEQTYTGDFVKKGEEKGYFKFGGSTVVLLFEKNQIQLDDDLLRNTQNGYETSVKVGERIGISK
ncbi:MAG: phosphatidylserine decarboxylase [Bacteroidetes bacterium]|nr:phosphatidylserine decarboxylase [Bacteroidota bacterium]